MLERGGEGRLLLWCLGRSLKIFAERQDSICEVRKMRFLEQLLEPCTKNSIPMCARSRLAWPVPDPNVYNNGILL